MAALVLLLTSPAHAQPMRAVAVAEHITAEQMGLVEQAVAVRAQPIVELLAQELPTLAAGVAAMVEALREAAQRAAMAAQAL